ncbi:MAG: hypothetical protein HC892_19260 [Saprospiraceae bacterium]|nr:hypothetical protein [Saprospiraceae bacterium]
MYIPLNLPEKAIDDWKIESFQAEGVKYQQLTCKGIVIMANTPPIVAQYVHFLEIAEGNILINGLGIGMCSQYLLNKASVSSLTVVEFNKTVIELVAPNFAHYPNHRVIHANAFEFEPPKDMVYNLVWHDIWTLYSSKNLQEMDILFEKYSKFALWQGAWARADCIKMKIKEQIHHNKH